MGDEENAVKCCQKAVEIDETFHKAYSRLGSIYDRQGKSEQALEQYKLALKHAPDSKEYQSKISALEGELESSARDSNPFANMFGAGAGGGMPDMSQLLGGGGAPNVGALLQDPNFMNMAMQMMQQPGVQEMMQNMMQNMGFDAGPSMSQDGHRAAMDKILKEEEVQNNARLKEIFERVRDGGPQTLLEYVGDPEVSQFMMKYASKNMGADADQLRNMFGGFGGPKRDDDSNNNMYS